MRLTQHRFEKHATVPLLKDCQIFFTEKKYRTVGKRIAELNRPVGSLFFQANKECENDGFPLLEGDGYLTRSLRKAFAGQRHDTRPSQTEDAGTLPANGEVSPLDALATVAIATAAEDESDLSLANPNDQCPESGLNQIDMTAEERTFQPQWWLSGSSNERRDPTISNLQLYSSPDRVDQSLIVPQDVATEDWNLFWINTKKLLFEGDLL